MGRIKYAEVTVAAFKKNDPEFMAKPDQSAFRDVLADNTEENYHWYTNHFAFVEDLANYKNLNDWFFKVLYIPQIVLDYLTGININTNEEEEQQ